MERLGGSPARPRKEGPGACAFSPPYAPRCSRAFSRTLALARAFCKAPGRHRESRQRRLLSALEGAVGASCFQRLRMVRNVPAAWCERRKHGRTAEPEAQTLDVADGIPETGERERERERERKLRRKLQRVRGKAQLPAASCTRKEPSPQPPRPWPPRPRPWGPPPSPHLPPLGFLSFRALFIQKASERKR